MLGVCVVLLSCGCSRVPVICPPWQETQDLRSRVASLETLLADREKELAAVREALRLKEETLRENQLRIEQLRRQLESVGIFGN